MVFLSMLTGDTAPHVRLASYDAAAVPALCQLCMCMLGEKARLFGVILLYIWGSTQRRRIPDAVTAVDEVKRRVVCTQHCQAHL